MGGVGIRKGSLRGWGRIRENLVIGGCCLKLGGGVGFIKCRVWLGG